MSTETLEVQHDEITNVLAMQISQGIDKINEGNKTLIDDEESGTKDSEIDKAFREKKVDIKAAVAEWNKAEKAKAAYKEALNKARNQYRVEVLGEEPKESVDEISEKEMKEQLKEVRAFVMKSLTLALSYAEMNKRDDLLAWANSIEVPQVGRSGSSTASGTKKPRAYVEVDGKRHDSFGQAAKYLTDLVSTKENKVSFNAGDVVQAWSDADESETFDFQGHKVKVIPKNADQNGSGK